MNLEIIAVWTLIGGVGLFLIGIELLSKGLRLTTGPLMKRIFQHLSASPIRGAFSGLSISTLIHNGPTTVMILGYVNAGILTLARAIPIIFGANIGTTVSMQIVSFNLGAYSFLILSIGVLLRRYTQKQNRLNELSLVIIGFGLMFVGLETTKHAFESLRDSAPILYLVDVMQLHTFGSYFLLIIISTLITAAVQSSGVVVSLLFSMASVGLITDFRVAIPFLLGAHIGSSFTALVAASSGGASMWRLALVQVLFNIIGAVAATILIPFYEWFIPFTATDATRQIANFNTFKQVISVVLFLPVAKLFERVSIQITKLFGVQEEETSHLDPALLERPERAILAVLHELQRQAGITRKMLTLSLEGMVYRNARLFRTVSLQAKAVLTIQRETQNYISLIADRRLEPRQVYLIQRLALASHSVEGVSQHVQGLGRLLEEKIQRKLWFPEDYMRRFIYLSKSANEMMELTINGMDPTGSVPSKCAEQAFSLGEQFHLEVADLKERVKTDVTEQGTDGTVALLFLRYLYTLERIVNYLLALAVQEKDESWNVRESRMLDVSALRSRVVQRLTDPSKRDSYENLVEQLKSKG